MPPRPRLIRSSNGNIRYLAGPRPLRYLASFRCIDKSRTTALDTTVLEALITLAQLEDGTADAAGNEVRIDDILNLLPKSPDRKKLVVDSLSRLATRSHSVAGVRSIRKRRVRATPKPATYEEREENIWAVAEEFGEQMLHDVNYSFDGYEEGDYDLDDRILTNLESSLGIIYGDSVTGLVSKKLGHDGNVPYNLSSDNTPANPPPREFQPIGTWNIVSDTLSYSLSPVLWESLRFDEPGRQKLQPYAYIDNTRLGRFRCRYSGALLRAIMSHPSSWEKYRKQGIRARYFVPRPRVGVWTLEMRHADFAEACGYSISSGGIAAQLRRNVIGEPGSQRVADEFRNGGVSDIALRFQVTSTVVCITVRWLPDLRSLKSRVLLPPTKGLLDNVTSEKERQLRLWEEKGYRESQSDSLRPPECDMYRPSKSTWSKAANLLDITISGTTPYVDAWTLAIDEALCSTHPYYGALTDNTANRLRGSVLLSKIDEEGVDRAFLWFLLEERDKPDLTLSVVLARLRYDWTLQHAREASKQRKLNGPKSDVNDRSRRIDGLAEHLEQFQAMVDAKTKRESQQLKALLDNKRLKAEERRLEFNSKRRRQRKSENERKRAIDAAQKARERTLPRPIEDSISLGGIIRRGYDEL